MIKNIAQYLDLASHRANTTHHDIQKICHAVQQYHLNAVFLNPCYIAYAKEQCKTFLKVGTVVSFPLGQELLATKIACTKQAAQAGADELDVSLNVAHIKEARWDNLLQEMQEIIHTARAVNSKIIVKFIPETGYLTPYEIQKIAEYMVQAGADFYKTCSGMGPRGATLEDVTLVREAVGSAIKIKVAGGVKTYQQACAFINAGAHQIGTSSAVEIIEESLRQ